MRILYDPHVFNSCVYGGIAKYYTELWLNLPKGMEPKVSVIESSNAHLREAGFGFPTPKHTFQSFLPNINFRGKFWLYHFLGRHFPSIVGCSEEANERYFRRLVYGGDYDLIHLTGVRGHKWVFTKCARMNKPVMVTCFDLIPELYHNDKVAQRENRYAYSVASHIIAISEHTKRDLCEFYHVPEDKVRVVYLGCDNSAKKVEGSYNPIGNCRYGLYVGKRTGYKNFDFFVRAIAPVLKQDNSLKVFCTGTPFSKTESDLFEQLGVRSKFVQQFVSDEQFPQ